MRRFLQLVFPVLVASTAIVGCRLQNVEPGANTDLSAPPEIVPTFVAHTDSHDPKGPHGGRIIEIGRTQAYHAELIIEEDTGSIVVYILDQHLDELAIDQDSIILSVLDEQRPKAVELNLSDATKTEGSKFTITDLEVAHAFQAAEAAAKLHVTIQGRPYVGHIKGERPCGFACQHVH